MPSPAVAVSSAESVVASPPSTVRRVSATSAKIIVAAGSIGSVASIGHNGLGMVFNFQNPAEDIKHAGGT
jgi:hypothetical protein